MIYIRPEDAVHKSYLNRLLIELIDNPILSQNLLFKGGTCASMLGFLDRFSVDLDFDVSKTAVESDLRSEFSKIFSHAGLTIQTSSSKSLFFLLHYPSSPEKRNTIRVSAVKQGIRSNIYKVQYFPEIDRLINSQTIETMFANKLAAVTDRYEKYHTIAGRDIYDIHHFFTHGYAYIPEIITERTKLYPKEYLFKLAGFIRKHVTQTIISEDLNTLLPNDHFQRIRKIILPETLHFLKDALKGDTIQSY